MEINFDELLSLPELSLEDVQIEPSSIHIYCQSNLTATFCPHCLTKNESVNQTHIRQVRDLPIIGKKTFIHLTTRQFVCSNCNRYYYEKFSFLEPHETVTQRYANSVFKLCNGIELQHVVIIEDLTWQTVNRIFQKHASKQIAKNKKDKNITRIGIDEIALKKGHKDYVAVIVNLDTGEVMDLLEDRSKSFIIKYFREKGQAFCEQISLFCCDLWEGYLSAASELFPKASIVTDRFHFYAKIQHAMDLCRKQMRRKYNKDEDLKNLKWILLKNEEDLSSKERILLKQILGKSEYKPLKDTYELKNKFRSILEMDISKEEAEKELEKWIEEVGNNAYLQRFTYFYERNKEYILNYFEGRYHTSLIEGINNKIKSIKRRAYGFANFEFFRIRVISAFMI